MTFIMVDFENVMLGNERRTQDILNPTETYKIIFLPSLDDS